jgi:radical SAM protein with 4Fe4S-binding SPASM domain
MNAEKLMDRFCPGYFVLTPTGEISMCTRITSSHEKGYADNIFGQVTNEKVNYNYEHYDKMINKTVMQNCDDCLAKFHCAGSCLAQIYAYNEDQINAVCDFTREFTKQHILKNIISTNK